MNKSIAKSLTVVAIALVPAVLPVCGHAQDLKIGLVITQRLLTSTTVGQAAAGTLREKKMDAQEKLDKKASEIQELKNDLEKRLMVLSAEEKDKAREDFERRQRDGLRLKEDLERELQKEENKILGEVNEFLSKIIIEYGKANGYDLVLDASATLYFSEAPDVTDDIIEAADRAYKEK